MKSNSICHTIHFENTADIDIIVGLINQLEIDGLEEDQNSCKLYYQESGLTEEIKSICSSVNFSATHHIEIIEQQNWNAIWESNFDPVFVNDFCAIHAPFHSIDSSNYVHTIQIMPKMSFGTGHHETTRMMVQQMEQMNFKDKRVFDFGCGTAVLAILAEKLGASDIEAIDNMTEAVQNGIENAHTNGCKHINVAHADRANAVDGKFDIVLANIIRRVILDNLETLADQVKTGGYLVISGFLKNDREQMRFACEQQKLNLVTELSENNWICQRYQKA